MESLAAAGAFDLLEPNRARVIAAVDVMLAAAQRAHESTTLGQNELFGGPASREKLAIPAAEPWLAADRLQREYDAVGFFLSGHPLDDYAALLKGLKVQSWVEFSRAVKAGATAGRVAATVVERTERRTKTGNKMGILGLSDPTGHYEAVIFAEGLQQYRDMLEPGSPVLLFLTAEAQGDDIRARIQSVEPLDQAAAKLQKGLRVFLRDDKPIDAICKRLAQPPAGARAHGCQIRRRGQHGAAAGRRHGGRGQAARPFPGLPADRRRDQGGAGRESRCRRYRQRFSLHPRAHTSITPPSHTRTLVFSR